MKMYIFICIFVDRRDCSSQQIKQLKTLLPELDICVYKIVGQMNILMLILKGKPEFMPCWLYINFQETQCKCFYG